MSPQQVDPFGPQWFRTPGSPVFRPDAADPSEIAVPGFDDPLFRPNSLSLVDHFTNRVNLTARALASEGLPLTELPRIAIEEAQRLGLSEAEAKSAVREGMRRALTESAF